MPIHTFLLPLNDTPINLRTPFRHLLVSVISFAWHHNNSFLFIPGPYYRHTDVGINASAFSPHTSLFFCCGKANEVSMQRIYNLF